MKTKSLFCFVLLFLCSLPPLSAQQRLTFRVADFHQNPLDLTARNDQFKRTDDNGALYSIIKVTSDLPDDELKSYVFDFGLMNSSTEIHQDDGELWVYVQKNAKTVTIRREGYATINKYDLGTTIASGATYEMRLSVQAATVHVQMVVFRVKPATARAMVMVKDELKEGPEEVFGMVDESGAVAKSLPFGSYTYRVAAENYYPSEGRFTLNNQAENHVEDVTLRGNFGNITLNAESDADIYVDGEKKGTRTWTGALKAGNHQVECRQANHKPTSQAITVAENETRTISLTPPSPITGTLSITSRPLGARILIDGKDYGETPRNIENLLVGRHVLEFTMNGYKPGSQNIEIKENIATILNLELEATTNEIDSKLLDNNINSHSTNRYSRLEKHASKGIHGAGIQLAGNTPEHLGFGVGVKYYYGLTNYVRLEPSFAYYFGSSSAYETALLINVQVFFLSTKFAVRPYIYAGFGYTRYKRDGDYIIDGNTIQGYKFEGFGVDGGLGFDIKISKRLYTQIEIGLIKGLGCHEKYIPIALNAGLTYNF